MRLLESYREEDSYGTMPQVSIQKFAALRRMLALYQVRLSRMRIRRIQ